MCSYCGCEAEAVVAGLMADHAVIADLVYRIRRTLEDRRFDQARDLTAHLAEAFEGHSFEEEAGLFAQLRAAGEAIEEVEDLIGDHRCLRPALSDPAAVDDPQRLLLLLDDLMRHAEIEDNDLFPFAMQQLPDACWSALSSRQPV